MLDELSCGELGCSISFHDDVIIVRHVHGGMDLENGANDYHMNMLDDNLKLLFNATTCWQELGSR